jgi:outer membrane murein-binding lipoprotein Lpp
LSLSPWIAEKIIKLSEATSQLAALGQATNERVNSNSSQLIKLESEIDQLDNLPDRVKALEDYNAADVARANKRKEDREARQSDILKESAKGLATAAGGYLVAQWPTIYKWFMHH